MCDAPAVREEEVVRQSTHRAARARVKKVRRNHTETNELRRRGDLIPGFKLFHLIRVRNLGILPELVPQQSAQLLALRALGGARDASSRGRGREHGSCGRIGPHPPGNVKDQAQAIAIELDRRARGHAHVRHRHVAGLEPRTRAWPTSHSSMLEKFLRPAPRARRSGLDTVSAPPA